MISCWRLLAVIIGTLQHNRLSNGLPMNSSPYYPSRSRRLAECPAAASEGPHIDVETIKPTNHGFDRRNLEPVEATELQHLEELLGIKLEYDLRELATLASRNITNIPWTSSYWPNWRNGIGRRWRNKTVSSAAEKYGQAYKVADFFEQVTKYRGVKSEHVGPRVECSSIDDCDAASLVQYGCAKLEEETSGICMLKWYGLCHAWAAASLMEDEPICPVTVGKLVFEPLDIKALLIQAYDGAVVETAFIGQRCKTDNNDTDKYGRYISADRRDINAGAFFVAVVNLIGLHDRGFIMDTDAGRPVWNQPVFGYNIERLIMVNPTKVAKELLKAEKYPFNPNMVRLAYVKLRVYWMGEQITNKPSISTGRYKSASKSSKYHMLLELSEDFEILGGEFIKSSLRRHPDFIWILKGPAPDDTATGMGLDLGDVRKLVKRSRECEKK
ncbi:unnamed protein product [Albugo candida]|uniref:Uncharacterized protein n=1 Tax=Albugo candida TaxID=65357 RepID=A0A024G1K6_9STRA|nr:unnamed protein product [Albugo candida]|eukprot:CCI40733.1 unnamed protein product [Albugo candida]